MLADASKITMSRQFVTIFATDDAGCVLLTEHPDGQLWLPHSQIDPTEAVDDTYKNLLASCNVEATTDTTLHFRSQSVGGAKWTNYLYKVGIRIKKPTQNKRFRFTALGDLQKCAELRSDEFVSRGYASRIAEVQQSITPQTPEFKAVLEELGFENTIREALVTTIIDHVWPCERYSERSFESLTNKLYGEKLSKCGEIFSRVVCRYEERYADFESLPVTVALLEPSLKNGAIRCRFIFEYYNRQGNGKLSSVELDELLQDLHADQPEAQEAAPDVKTLYELLGHGENAEMSCSQFTEHVRSTSSLEAACILRAPRSIYQFFMYDALTAPPVEIPLDVEASGEEGLQVALHEYSVEDWLISLDSDDRIVLEVCSWWEIPNDERQQSAFTGDAYANASLEALHYPRHMLDLLKHYVSENDHKKAWTLGDKNIVDYYQTMMKICEIAKPIFLGEKRVLELKSPIYIFGDMHGNYRDFLRFEQSFWPAGPQASPCAFVFIGDFVDRSRNGFLLMANLLSCKILAPEKFFLVRGDHGSKSACRSPGQECHEFFIETGLYGSQMFKQIRDVFDHLPLAAVVDDRIFCTHGGFGDGLLLPFGIEAINLIQNPLADPKKHPLARQLLWLDSRSSEGDAEESDDTLFLGNKRRKLTQNFSRDTLSKFLERNRLSFVIRGHQYNDPGYQVCEDNRLLTVSTPSNADGHSHSETTFILVDHDAVDRCTCRQRQNMRDT